MAYFSVWRFFVESGRRLVLWIHFLYLSRFLVVRESIFASKGVVFFHFPGKDTFRTKTSKKVWARTFCGIFFPALSGKKKHPYNTVETLRPFSVTKLGHICVWVLRFLDKNRDNIGTFVVIVFYNWKSTLPSILTNICTNISCFSDEILNKIYIFQK